MTDKSPDMTPEELRALRNKKEYVIADLRRKWQRGELTDDQVLQLESLGIRKHSAKDVTPGYNDLETTHPNLAAEWHLVKNDNLTPQDVGAGSNKRVWWLGKCGHEWEAKVCNRSNGKGCPYCSNVKLLVGFNDLATTHPDLAAEWHPVKNESLTPRNVIYGSTKKVWWRCGHGHEWEVTIRNRTRSGSGCPYCANKKVLPGYNDLVTRHPEFAAEWHPTKNDNLTPQEVTAGSNKKVWWRCKHGHEWQATIVNRTKNGSGCPYCTGREVIRGLNDLSTVNQELADQWHPYKNGELTPENVSTYSNRRIWWRCDNGHEWEAAVADRSAGQGCPYCSGHRCLPGYNDLATKRPDLAAEWHPVRNGALTPQDVGAGSNKKVWWKCVRGHEWQATVTNRSRNGSGCPVCARDARKKKDDQR